MHQSLKANDEATSPPRAMLVVKVPNGAVAKSSANGLVGTEFASRYRLQTRAAL